MAGWYTAALDALLQGDVDLINDTISVMLIDTGEYTVDLDNHISQTDVPDAAVWSIATLTGKTVLDSVFRANDVVFSDVTEVEVGDTAGALILFVNKETYSESLLLAYIDNAPEFPVALDGEDVSVYWDPVDGIMAL